MPKSYDQTSENNDRFYRSKLIASIGGLVSTVIFLFWFMGNSLIGTFERLSQSHIYVLSSSWDFPLLISLPCFLALIVALLLRLTKQATERRIGICIKVALVFALISIGVRLAYGYWMTHYLEQKGYVSCWHYSSPSLMSPTVWVKQPTYCIENAGKVRREVLIWMDSLPNNGLDVPATEVAQKVSEMLLEWEKKEKEKFPLIYQ